MVHQFVCYRIFPPLRKSVIYLPKAAGGLGVIDITVQQHILQQRYVRALLLENQGDQKLPDFLLQLLSTFIQVIYGVPFMQLSLLSRNYRWGSPLSGLHCLLPLLRSVDAFFIEDSWDQFQISLDTLLQFSFVALCRQDATDLSIIQHRQIRQKPASVFLVPSRLSESLVVKARSNCPNPELLSQILRVINASTLSFISYVNVYLSTPSGPSLQVTGNGVDFLPYLRHKLAYQGIMVLSMVNSQLRTMYMRDHPPIIRPALDVTRLTVSSFLRTRMHSPARTLWFWLMHNKASSKVNLRPILKLPDEMCVFCGGRETTAHMLFTCPSHADAW
ncbi:hypothetical protein BD408DRAFT_468607 [Parasitella parasitica]|nr:hypothetical protein BD408DRAFT_468607 [Parasitella parasitica]